MRFPPGPHGTLSSVAERSLHTGKAVGSIPTGCTKHLHALCKAQVRRQQAGVAKFFNRKIFVTTDYRAYGLVV